MTGLLPHYCLKALRDAKAELYCLEGRNHNAVYAIDDDNGLRIISKINWQIG